MADILIRDVPDAVVMAVNVHAGRLGLSRSEYLRRWLTQDAAVSRVAVEVSDLARLAGVTADLDDQDVIAQAWR